MRSTAFVSEPMGSMVMVTDIWGHYHSRIIDDSELISYWARTHKDE